MVKIPTNHLLVTHQREAINLDKKGVSIGLARLNNMFDTNIKENNKVVESPLIISKVMCITTHLGWEHS
jgi:hypothetical protein